MSGIPNTVRYLLHTCGIIHDPSIEVASRKRNFSRALDAYVSWGNIASKNRLAGLKDRWEVLKKPFDVLRGQENSYLDPNQSPVISTTTNPNIAACFTDSNIIFSIHVMPGIRYINVEHSKSLMEDTAPEDEFILEGGQDLYIAPPIKYTGKVVESELDYDNDLESVDFTYKLKRKGMTLIRCVYAPKGSPPIDSIDQNPLFSSPKYNKQVKLTKYISSQTNNPSGGGIHRGSCSPESYAFLEQLKELQSQSGGKRKNSSRRMTRKKSSSRSYTRRR